MNGLQVPFHLDTFDYYVSRAQAARMWAAAGLPEPAEPVIYPLLAADLALQLFSRFDARPVVTSRLQVDCHRVVLAPARLQVGGVIAAIAPGTQEVFTILSEIVHVQDDGMGPAWSCSIDLRPLADDSA